MQEHTQEYGTVCRNPFCRIRQSVPTLPILPNFFSAKWASKFGKVGKAVVYICKNRLFESENIMWGDVFTLALTVAKTSSHYGFAISISGPKGLAEFGKVSLPCPFCRIFFRQSGIRQNGIRQKGHILSTIVTSHSSCLPISQGIMVTPSGRLPSVRYSPRGSSTEGKSRDPNVCFMRELRVA